MKYAKKSVINFTENLKPIIAGKCNGHNQLYCSEIETKGLLLLRTKKPPASVDNSIFVFAKPKTVPQTYRLHNGLYRIRIKHNIWLPDIQQIGWLSTRYPHVLKTNVFYVFFILGYILAYSSIADPDPHNFVGSGTAS